MASNLLYLLFLVASAGSAIGALGYQFDIPDTLTYAKSLLDDATAKFLKSLLEGGLVLTTPDVCRSLGFFCAHEISTSSELLNAALESHSGHSGSNWINKQPYGVFTWANEERPSKWVNKQPYGVFTWANEDRPSKWVKKQPYGVFTWANNEKPSKWVNKQPYGVFSWANDEQPSKWVSKQPYGVFTWANDEQSSKWVNKQPYGVFTWANDEQSKWVKKQPYGVFTWANDEQSKWVNKQPYSVFTWANEERLKQKLENLPTKGRAFRFTLVLRAFNLSANSEMGHSLEFALDMGESTNNDVEIRKSVATTKEMFDFVGGVLCKEKEDCHLKSVAQSFENKDSKMVKVVDVELVSKDPVACHTVPFPYKVYVCHKIKESPVYKVNMMVEGGKTLSAPFICHWDTSKFRTNHQAFEDLNMKPGEGEICHWLAYETIVWYV